MKYGFGYGNHLIFDFSNSSCCSYPETSRRMILLALFNTSNVFFAVYRWAVTSGGSERLSIKA